MTPTIRKNIKYTPKKTKLSPVYKSTTKVKQEKEKEDSKQIKMHQIQPQVFPAIRKKLIIREEQENLTGRPEDHQPPSLQVRVPEDDQKEPGVKEDARGGCQEDFPAMRKIAIADQEEPNTQLEATPGSPSTTEPMMEKMFTVGSASLPKTPIGGGRVLEAKRILEEQIRKTKRDNKVKEFRPLISTPTEKRSRGEDGVWETPSRPLSIPRTPATPGRRLQTPIQQFLVKQSLEDRRKSIFERRDKEERSSSPAKPVRKKLQAGTNARAGNLKKLQMKPGKVSSILKYFENAEDVPESSKLLVRRSARYNNNVLSPPQLTQTEPGSAQPVQQMAPQPNFDRNDAQPTATSALGHVTNIKTSAPMKGCHLTSPKKSGIISHL